MKKSVGSRLCEHVWTLQVIKNKTKIEQAKQMKESSSSSFFFFFCVYTRQLLIPDSALLFMNNLNSCTGSVSVVSVLYHSISMFIATFFRAMNP